MNDPHDIEPRTAGLSIETASAVVIMVHGRGATADSILAMREEFSRDDVAYLAPQAAGNSWYPNSFLAPVEQNEPGRTSGLNAIERLVERAGGAGVDLEHVLLLGFSQGACLTTEFAATCPRRYGGVVALSGGLIGETLGKYNGDLDGTPVFLGCSDVDPHIPVERVHETKDVFESMGATVEERIYEGMGHGVNRDELDQVRAMIGEL